MLVNSSSLIELELDFAEEDIEFVSYENVKEEIKKIIEEIEMLIDSYKIGRVLGMALMLFWSETKCWQVFFVKLFG